jgi:O-antigen ligase
MALLTMLGFSFVLSGFRFDTGFIVLEPWLVVLPTCLAVWLTRVAMSRRVAPLDAIGYFALALLFSAWLSYFGAIDVTTWLKRAMKITWLFGLYLLVTNWAADKRALAALVKGALWGCALAAATMSYQLFQASQVRTSLLYLFGVSGTFANSNEGATFMAIVVLIGLSLYAAGVFHGVATKRGMLLLLGACVVGIVVTRSRTAVVGLVAVGAMFFVHDAKSRPLVLGLFATLITLALVPSTSVIMDRLLGTVGVSGDEAFDEFIQGGTATRLYLLQLYWTAIEAYPIFGIGAGNYGFLEQTGLNFPPPPADVLQTVVQGDHLRLSSHNGFMNWWVETGTIGVVAFVAVLLYSIFALLRARRVSQRCGPVDAWWLAMSRGALAGLLMFIITNFTGEFGVSEIRLWLLLALSTLSIRELRRSISQAPPRGPRRVTWQSRTAAPAVRSR